MARKSMKSHLVALTIGAMAALGLTSAALAQAVVVRSTGPSASQYPKGKKLAAGSTIVLKDKDVVTVLDKAGTRVLVGPRTVSVDSRSKPDRSALSTLSGALRNPTAFRAGAVRSAGSGDQATVEQVLGGKQYSPSLWLANIARGEPSRVCVPEGSDLFLWRDDVSTKRYIWLSDEMGGAMVRVLMPEGTAGVPWPKLHVAPTAGSVFTVVDENAAPGADPAKLTLVALPSQLPEDPDALAALLLENSCIDQVERLADLLLLDEMDRAAREQMAGS